jgi:hypothetical protein
MTIRWRASSLRSLAPPRLLETHAAEGITTLIAGGHGDLPHLQGVYAQNGEGTGGEKVPRLLDKQHQPA